MINYVELYAGLVKSGKITLERVPVKYRESVKDAVQNGL